MSSSVRSTFNEPDFSASDGGMAAHAQRNPARAVIAPISVAAEGDFDRRVNATVSRLSG
jgi:hypothetical protein